MMNNYIFKINQSTTKMGVLLLLCLAFNSQAQNSIVPDGKSFQKQWLKPEKYEMSWYAVRDTQRMKIGNITTTIRADQREVTIITQIAMQGRNTAWVDTTIAEANSFRPIYHSSYNPNRDMIINFGKVVRGLYHDKTKGTQVVISDTTMANYFDSNIYPHVLRWLPLKEGYTATIPIYDFNPNGKKGIVNAYVEKVETGTYQLQSKKEVKVWRVTVSDELNVSDKSVSTYFIGKEDRKLWRQEVVTGNRRMVMIAAE